MFGALFKRLASGRAEGGASQMRFPWRETMSESKKRKVHTAEFKAKVGLEASRGVKAINEIGQEYGVHPVTVGQ